MSIILRVDVDKPFGNKGLYRKITSKIYEDIVGTYPWYLPKYLTHLTEFLIYCNKNNVKGIFFHRLCTIPNNETIKLLIEGGHKYGMHAENTKTFETFSAEFHKLKSKSKNLDIKDFSKHGSGVVKIGKYHYPKYEPEKYLIWGKQLGINFHSGNGIVTSADDFILKNGIYEKIFWIEPEYRDNNFYEIEKLIEVAKTKDVVVLIHPCNYHRDEYIKNQFHLLVELAKKSNIEWKI